MCEIPQRTADRSTIIPEVDPALIRNEVRHVLGVLRTGSKVCRGHGFGRPPRSCRSGPRGRRHALALLRRWGSMAGNVSQGIATIKPRIDEARHALAAVLPRVTRLRRVGLVTYGPGAYNQCNVQLKFEP